MPLHDLRAATRWSRRARGNRASSAGSNGRRSGLRHDVDVLPHVGSARAEFEAPGYTGQPLRPRSPHASRPASSPGARGTLSGGPEITSAYPSDDEGQELAEEGGGASSPGSAAAKPGRRGSLRTAVTRAPPRGGRWPASSAAQGWAPSDSLWYYNVTQGSDLLPYDFFLALEQEKSEESFRAPANMNRFRYLPQKKTRSNQIGRAHV